MSENAIKGFWKDKKLLWLILCGVLGVFLLIFASGMGKQDQKEEESQTTLPDAAAYAQQVEGQIKSLCSQVRGAGSVSVAVTLKGGYRAVYATDSQSSGSGYKNNTVLIGSGSSEDAILIGYENPEISGIGIVCRGASDPTVRESIISLVAAAFDIRTNKIYVAVGQES